MPTTTKRTIARTPYDHLHRRPWLFTRTGRRAHPPSPTHLLLHTFQAREAWESLSRDGVLVGDRSLGCQQEQSETREAYDWMRDRSLGCQQEQSETREAYDWMRDRLTAHTGETGTGMVWFWVNVPGRHLRSSARHESGAVLVTAHIPRERVLVTGFDDWHRVLNRTLAVPFREEETLEDWSERFDHTIDDWYERTDPHRSSPITQWPPTLRQELETSWESIVTTPQQSAGHYLQAVTAELRADDVVRAWIVR